MKVVATLKGTYHNIIGPLNENFDEIEHQWSEVLDSCERTDLLCIVLEFAINDMDMLDFTENVATRLGDDVSSAFINTLLLNINLATVFKFFHSEASKYKLDLTDGHMPIRVLRFGPNLSVLEQ